MTTIYYGDGTEWNGDPWDAPPENVQAIAWDDKDKSRYNIGRVVLKEWDIYIYSDRIGWHGANKYADLMRHLKKRPCVVRSVLEGEWTNKENFREIIKRAEVGKSAEDPIREDGSE